jgi:tetratricopeptide (TPR) repeat protein
MKPLIRSRVKARSRRTVIAAVLLSAAAVLLTARSLTHTGWYQHWRYGRMSLEQLATEAKDQRANPIVLYYYGKSLDASGRYTEALVPLERSAGLDPDDARVRGEWSIAQLAGGYITGAFGQLTQFVHSHPDSAEGHMILGRFYVAQNSYARATEELEQAVRFDPRLGEAWSLLAGARQQLGSYAPARDAARQAVALRPKSAVDHMLLATLLLATNDRNGARQEYAAAVALAPNEPGLLCGYARLLLKDGDAKDISLAEQMARRAVAVAPDYLEASFDLGRALMQEGKPAEALEPLKIAASTLPQGTPQSTLPANEPDQFLDPASALELARAYRKLGRETEAASWEQRYLRRQKMADEDHRLSDAVRDHPERVEAHRQRAIFLAQRGEVEGVARSLAQAMHSAPDAPTVLVATANALTDAGYGMLSAPLARRAAAFSQNSPAVFEAWGNALLAIGQTHEAAVKYAKAAGWWPEKMPLYQQKIADCVRQRKQHPSEAEKLYAQAVALRRASLGAALNADRVQSLLERAVTLEPGNTDYRRALLRLLVRRHEPVEAEQAARELLVLSPEDGTGHAMLALILLQRSDSENDLAEVEAHLNQAERVGMEESAILPTVHYGQGVLAMRREQAREAVRLLRLAAAEDPSADATYFQLAQAESLAGNLAEAAKARTELSTRQERKQEQRDLLNRIVEKPNDRQRYVEAIRFFTRCGMKAQADAVEIEMRRRFGAGRS